LWSNSLGFFEELGVIPRTPMPIDYLEYEINIYFIDKDNYETRIYSEFPLSPFSTGETLVGYTVADSYEESSRLILAMYDNEPYFSTSFWQKAGTGLIPTSGQCLNKSICFDEIKPVIYIIKELQQNIKIIDDEIILRNNRVTDVIRIDSNTIQVTANSDGIMPDDEYNHYILPRYTMWVPFEFTQQSEIDDEVEQP